MRFRSLTNSRAEGKKSLVVFYFSRCMSWFSCIFFLISTVFALAAIFLSFNPDFCNKFFWLGYSPILFIVGCVFSLAIFALLFAVFRHKPRTLIALFLLCIVCRLALTAFVAGKVEPFSDYDQVWSIAQGIADPTTLLYKSFFPEWSNWAAVQKLIVDEFDVNYGAMIWIESALSCLVAFEVLVLAKEITGNRKTALLAGSLYAFMPSQVLYTFVSKPDTVALAFIMGALILCVKMNRARGERISKVVCFSLGAGALFCLGGAFKPVASIGVIGFVICWLAYWNKNLVFRFKEFVKLVLPIAIVVSMVAVFPNLTRQLASDELDVEVASSATASYLCIGLNSEGEGQIHLGSKSRFYNTARLAGESEGDATRKTFEMLKQDWKENAGDLPALFAKKVRWAWQDDMMPARYALIALESSIDNADDFFAASAASSQLYYLLIMLLAALFFIGVIRQKRQLSFGEMLIVLFILGFVLLLFLSEAQSRYKSNILPMVSILSAMGFKSLVFYLKAWVADREKRFRSMRRHLANVKRGEENTPSRLVDCDICNSQ